MNRICLAFSVLILISTSFFGQTERPKPNELDVKDAKNLAVSFFHRYQQTQDITPLIKEFFVADFGKRLVFCRTTRECEGFARDMWKGPEQPLPFTPTENDYVREYAAQTNYLYLGSSAGANFATDFTSRSSASQHGADPLSAELKALLKDRPEILKYDFFANPDEPYTEPATIAEFRKRQGEFEQLVAAYRIVESRSRAFLSKDARKELSGKDLRVSFADNDQGQFFKYPTHTQMLEVWPETKDILLIMDLIREGGKLKIVAVYMPID
jgi:hypothetical protein